jgi:hypothetical protein
MKYLNHWMLEYEAMNNPEKLILDFIKNGRPCGDE